MPRIPGACPEKKKRKQIHISQKYTTQQDSVTFFVGTYRRQVFRLGATLVVSSRVPPFVVFKAFSRYSLLPVPGSVVLEVNDSAIPAPGRRNPTTSDHLPVGGILVKVVTVASAAGSSFSHVDGKTVQLSIS